MTVRREVRDDAMLLLLDPVFGRLVARDGRPEPVRDYPPAIDFARFPNDLTPSVSSWFAPAATPAPGVHPPHPGGDQPTKEP